VPFTAGRPLPHIESTLLSTLTGLDRETTIAEAATAVIIDGL
jgi:hypothetical protein